MNAQAKATTKAAMVTRILSRDKGATVLEMSKATGWQPHSCRAFLTGLRKKSSILKEQRDDGKLAYRLQPTLAEVAEWACSSACVGVLRDTRRDKPAR